MKQISDGVAFLKSFKRDDSVFKASVNVVREFLLNGVNQIDLSEVVDVQLVKSSVHVEVGNHVFIAKVSVFFNVKSDKKHQEI